MKRFAVLLVPDFHEKAALRYALLRPGKPENPHVQTGSGVRLAHDVLLRIAEAFSPYMELTDAGMVTLELPAERARPWQEADFMEKAVHPLRAERLDSRVGVAATPDLAAMAARYAEASQPVRIVEAADAFLAPLPLAALQPGEELLAVLNSWGIYTVGQLRALPREEACLRLGAEALHLWNRAAGGEVRPLKLVRPREFYAETADLEYPVEALEPLMFLLRRFLEKITTRLAAAWLVAGRLRLVLRFDQGPGYRHVFTIPEPTRDVELLFRMLYTHLEGFTAESPIVGLELAAQPLPPVEKQGDLLDRSVVRHPQQLAETLARLEALLGPGRVGTPEALPSAHPDAFRMRPYMAAMAAVSTAAEPPLFGIPYLRFRPPVVARVLMEEGRPSYIQSAPVNGAIRKALGPWLLEGNWWNREHWTREEWDAATDLGTYRLICVREGWFLDGVYSFGR